MASGTVGYTDTRGNKDFSSVIASQIGKRLKEASDMAADERAFASKQAEAGGTSLEEAGIGKGYFFKRALGNRFGGDRIARTKGRMGMGGAANNPAVNYKQRFRGGFDYKVTNELNNLTDTAPLSGALATGLRGVQLGLSDISIALAKQDATLGKLANTQADMAKAIMFNGYLFQMFMSKTSQQEGRRSARREERSMERNFRRNQSSVGGQSFGGAGGTRGMQNVTPRGGGIGGGFNILDSGADAIRLGKSGTLTAAEYAPKAAKLAPKAAKAITTGVTAIATSGAGRKITKLFANQAIAKGIKKVGEKATPKLVAQSKKLAAGARNLKGMRDLTGSMQGAKRMIGTLGTPGVGLLDPEDLRFASMSLEELESVSDSASRRAFMAGDGVESAINIRAYGYDPNDANSMAKFYADATEGKVKGLGKLTKKQTDDLVKKSLGSDGYRMIKKKWKVPYKKGLKKTFTHKMLRAPGIPKSLATSGGKTAAKTTAKAGAKSLWKKIPVVAGIAGIVFGIQRALEGDLIGAGMEITSGLLGATGKLAPLSFALDSYLLARDLGMTPLRTGGTIFPGKTNSPLMIGNRMFNINEPGNKEIVRVEKDKKDRFVEQGIGIVEGMKKKKNDYISLQATGVESALSGLKGSGFFGTMFDNVANTVNTTKNLLSNLNPLNIVEGIKKFIPTTNPLDSIKNWFNKGYSPKEDTMKWKDLLADDWKQRGKFGKGGKLGGWDFTRGFRPGVAANEGGFGSGPTPAGRQAVKRGFGFLTSFKGGPLAALASLVANEFINPQPLADGTMDGYMKSVGGNNSMKLQNENVNPIATTVINNNYYNGGGQGGGQESANENLGQSFNDDLTKFITGFSIMSK
tara:strand:- start:1536 stop:4118 length:2583 start_codon:yes stop_codon:yes gene_type:complete